MRTLLLAILVLAVGCDSSPIVSEVTEAGESGAAVESDMLAKRGEDNGVVKEFVSYRWDFPPEFDDVVECLGGPVRTGGYLVAEGTTIATPGGRFVANWKVNYEESYVWADLLDTVGGDRVNPGPEHDWVLVKGNQTVHDVAMTDEWNPDMTLSDGPGMHLYSLREWYENTHTGEIQLLNFTARFFYEEGLAITKYMDTGYCPGKSGLK